MKNIYSKENLKLKFENNSFFELKDDYIINHRRKMLLLCKKCNKLWDVYLYQFINKSSKCPFCLNEEKAHDYYYIKNFIAKNKYILYTENYLNNEQKLTLKDLEGYKYYLSFREFQSSLKKFKFSRFYNGNIYTEENIILWINKNNENYNLLNINITGSKNKDLKLNCKKCNHTWNAAWDTLYHGKSCPLCRLSKGEKKIKNFLDNNKIKYISQYKFINCKNKKELPFDFYIPSKNLCIEYDGSLHYFDVFKNPKEFERRKLNDKIKSDYCEKNFINLFRISYLDFDNINEILNNIFSIREEKNETIR